MDQDNSGGAAAGGFFKFICPTPVIRQGFSAEQIRLAGCRGRIVDHYHQYLAFIIVRISAVIIPIEQRAVDAVTSKDQLRIDRNVRRLSTRRGYEIIAEFVRPAVSGRIHDL